MGLFDTIMNVTTRVNDAAQKGKPEIPEQPISNYNIRTAEGMRQYAIDCGYGGKMGEKVYLAGYQVILESLNPGEQVLTCFHGIYNYKSATETGGNCAFVVTNKRILVGGKGNILTGKTFYAVTLSNLTDITYNVFAGAGVITFESVGGNINYALDNAWARRVYNKVMSIWDNVRQSSVPSQ